ncbi:MAG: hypothetical protein KME08_02860 [Aphanothece sp. CMT-3BRIN-NPC111]|jgi:predicted ribosomally synthesized peptide with nif11-like leader|nr:hypothetical protein [Aphanothece sp. CMT-3BRIN-NPC111]
MLDQIKALLQEAQLRQQLLAAADREEVIKLITTAGAEKGYTFTDESVSQAATELMSEGEELTEEDLLAVAGGIGPELPSYTPKCQED